MKYSDINKLEIRNHPSKRAHYLVRCSYHAGEKQVIEAIEIDVAKSSPAGLVLQAFMKQIEVHVNMND